MTDHDSARGWQPTASLATLQLRASMLSQARLYFSQQDVMEVETPMLSPYAVSDINIESISAVLQLNPATPYFLHTSPEFCMKRLLAAGSNDIYQLGKVFRDGEDGSRHQPEFTMAEWYRRNFSFEQIIDDTVNFIRFVIGENNALTGPDRISYREAFKTYTGIDPCTADLSLLARTAGDNHHLNPAIDTDRSDWLDLILCRFVAPEFSKERITVLHHYPADQAALSRVNPDDPLVADRFEIFYGELELANGYVELSDADEQRQRCLDDQETRRAAGRVQRPLDQDLIAALHKGLPPCAGVAVGFDRLVMIAAGVQNIRDVISFAYNKDAN